MSVSYIPIAKARGGTFDKILGSLIIISILGGNCKRIFREIRLSLPWIYCYHKQTIQMLGHGICRYLQIRDLKCHLSISLGMWYFCLSDFRE